MTSERRRRSSASANGAAPEVVAQRAAEASPTGQPLAFEEALGRLDEAVSALETGNLPLEDALELYEEGMRMAQRCQVLLDRAELRVQRLHVIESEGALSFATDDFDLDADE